MTRPFRFGVLADVDAGAELVPWLQAVEALGYDQVCWPDHLDQALDPVVAIGVAAACTHRVRLASLVFADGTRHPLVHARIARTLEAVSGGRFDLGLGAGWRREDYERIGLPFDTPAVRIARLAASVGTIRAALGAATTTRVVIGGGGRALLAVAGAVADVVFLNPTLWPAAAPADRVREMAVPNVARKADLVRAAAARAGRDPHDVELGAMLTVVADRDEAARAAGASPADVAACATIVSGTGAEVRAHLRRVREATGVSTFVVQSTDRSVLERFAGDVVAALPADDAGGDGEWHTRPATPA